MSRQNQLTAIYPQVCFGPNTECTNGMFRLCRMSYACVFAINNNAHTKDNRGLQTRMRKTYDERLKLLRTIMFTLVIFFLPNLTWRAVLLVCITYLMLG